VDLYNPDDLPLPRQHPADMEKSRYRDVPPEHWRRMKAFFYAMCSLVDQYVGCILDSLQATGLAENTIIVFMSDHGDALGDHGQVAKGPSNYEAIVRVPCIVRWPGVLPAGRRVAALVESIDLFPTLCDLCGIAVPPGVKGTSVRGLLQGTIEHGRDDVLIEFKDPRSGFSVKTLRTDAYKYFRYHDGRETLYDLREEDEEVFNRVGDHAYQGVLQQIRERLLARLMRAEDDLPERTHDY
jgi:arylsulfatase A-like enzyme